MKGTVPWSNCDQRTALIWWEDISLSIRNHRKMKNCKKPMRFCTEETLISCAKWQQDTTVIITQHAKIRHKLLPESGQNVRSKPMSTALYLPLVLLLPQNDAQLPRVTFCGFSRKSAMVRGRSQFLLDIFCVFIFFKHISLILITFQIKLP